jgi:hypothetical protein
MALTRKQKEILRWYAAGHHVSSIAQYVNLDDREVKKELKLLEVTTRGEAESLLLNEQNVDRSDEEDDNWEKGGQEEPQLPKVKPQTKLQDWDKRKIADRGGNVTDSIPLSRQQDFRTDLKTLPYSEVKVRWLTELKTEEALKDAILEIAPELANKLGIT